MHNDKGAYNDHATLWPTPLLQVIISKGNTNKCWLHRHYLSFIVVDFLFEFHKY